MITMAAVSKRQFRRAMLRYCKWEGATHDFLPKQSDLRATTSSSSIIDTSLTDHSHETVQTMVSLALSAPIHASNR
jgi:hypothetical protein